MTRLSVCSVTLNSAPSLPTWAAHVRRYADELVLAVDSSSVDGTLGIAQKLADRTITVEHPRFVEEVLDDVFGQCRGDWILRLDDDEITCRAFKYAVHGLIANPGPTHYEMHRRWACRDDHGGYGWINSPPHCPDLSTRLIKNDRRLFRHPRQLHTQTIVVGPSAVPDPETASIYHLDLVWRSRREREFKVRERYGNAGHAFYLYEEGLSADALVPISDAQVLGLIEARS